MVRNPLQFVILIVIIIGTNCSKDWTEEQFSYKWHQYSKKRIESQLIKPLNGNVAKNLILYLGDGMGVSTVTAGRILKGQLAGNNGENHVTAMENMDNLALSKTYNINAQTADSAGTGTAFHTGVKTRIGSIGVDGTAVDCKTSLDAKLESVLKWAHFAGKSTGIITTARVTHATPAAAFASVPDRDWEAYDDKEFGKVEKSEGCKDIAAQLIEDNSFIDLIIGGGRRKFLRNTDPDYKNPNDKGDRTDNRNLIDEWTEKMRNQNLNAKFIWNKTDFMKLKPYEYDHVLGLLNFDHMQFEIDRKESNDEPTLAEMTKKAIELLRTNPRGFYLLVEAGKIDHGHHESKAHKALTDFVAFDEAIAEGLKLTDDKETLSVVTADHSHVFTIGGYNERGRDIFDLNVVAKSGKTLNEYDSNYTPLLYGNGPGALKIVRKFNLTSDETKDKNYLQEAAVKLKSETHGGEDVAIYAQGPMSHLFEGTMEQSHIAHLMAYSACIGLYNKTMYANCENQRGVQVSKSSAGRTFSAGNFYFVFSFVICLFISQNSFFM